MLTLFSLLVLSATLILAQENTTTAGPAEDATVWNTTEINTEINTERSRVQSVTECRDLATGKLYQIGDTWSNNVTCWQHTCLALEGMVYYYTTTCPDYYVPPHWTNCTQVRGPGLSYPECCPRPSCQKETNN